MSTSSNQHSPNVDLERRIREEILPLFESVIKGNTVPYRNRNLDLCWKAIQSDPCSCLAMNEGQDQEDLVLDVTNFNSITQGDARPYEACTRCDIFKNVCPTVIEELGEAFNTMVHILTQKDDAIMNAASLTRDLASSLEDMDMENKIIRERMITDTLTGLYNRHHMNECLMLEVERCHDRKRSLSLAMFDLDDFKDFNDTYGHLEGDKVLSALGKHLRNSIREYDLAFRYGGEEFLIMLPDTKTSDAIMVAERIRLLFANLSFEVPASVHHPSGQVTMTLSGGLASHHDGMGALELLELADKALYDAKRLGKNRVEVHPGLIPV